MTKFTGEIIQTRKETWDVKSFRIKKPLDFSFVPGQYCLISFTDKPEFSDESRPFTFTSSPTENGFVELTVKEMGEFTKAFSH